MSLKGKKLSDFEHILLRPDTYIGSIVPITQIHWIWDNDKKHAIRKKIKYNPGLFNIIREIVSNSIDNVWRTKDSSMSKIVFTVSLDTGEISVINDGYCIPVEKEEYEYVNYRTGKTIKETLYPAELFFGEAKAGTNFDDSEERKTSGKNGIGSKATNVFSKSFTVEHTDSVNKKKFSQTYTDNGKSRTKPKITSYSSGAGYTKITFTPDYDRFKMNMTEDFVALLRIYCSEAAMITGLPVTFSMIRNGSKETSKLVFKDLIKFVKLFYPTTKNFISFKTKGNDECVVIEGEEPDADQTGNVQHISYVNGIRTKDGGVHVDTWRDAVITPLMKTFNAKYKNKKNPLKTSAKQLYPYLAFFIRVELDQPSFDSQTKDRLNSPIPIISKPTAAEITKILKWNFVSLLEEKLLYYQERQIQRREGVKKRIVGSKNLTDANDAGSKNSLKCTLFITEGLSAKTLAESFVSFLDGGSDLHGAFAIKGKLLNVAKASSKQIIENKEIQELQSALGLIPHTDYSDLSNRKMLRYGRVNFFTDADDDGFHIRGLLANFFWIRYPSLWKQGFFDILAESTPVVKIWKNFTAPKPLISFYTNSEYQAWSKAKSTGKERVEYFKGLGTIGPEHVQEMVTNRNTVEFTLEGDEDSYMNMAFSEGESDLRKQWIVRDMGEGGDVYNEPEFFYKGKVGLSTFIDTNLLQYERITITRAIPSVLDGFKEGQRKIYYGLNKQGLTSERKLLSVERAASAATSVSGYHHGGVSAEQTVIKMAQGFVGSNNIPFLVNRGQFGTRRMGGKDASASRYVKTYVDPFSHLIFSKEDSDVLTYLSDDGHPVEPQFYMPILPMFLINGKAKAKGSQGIATGFATKCPPFNPSDIVTWIQAWLKDQHEDMPKLVPWWRGFSGDTEMATTKVTGKSESFDQVIVTGKLDKIEKGKFKGWWRISELPIGVWTNDVKEMLETLMVKQTKEVTRGGTKHKVENPAVIKDFKQYNNDNTVNMYFLTHNNFIPDMSVKSNPLSVLIQSITLSNIVGLDQHGYPRQYSNAEEVLEYWCPVRLEYYQKRKDWMLGALATKMEREENKYKFVTAVKEKDLDMNQDDDELYQAMTNLGLKKLSNGEDVKSFDYLLSMQMRTIMSKTKGDELKKQIDTLKKEIEILKSKSAKKLWNDDLVRFKKEYTKWLKTRKEEPTRSK